MKARGECRPPEGNEAAAGFGKVSNAIVRRGILAHMRAPAVKIYLAILLAARSDRQTCWPTVKTLARWSGVPEKKVSEETDYLERHKVIVKRWIQIGGKPRRIYHVVRPDDSMFPDLRGPCAECMNTDHQGSCVLRDPATGRLLGRRARPKSPDHRDPGITDHRDSHMITDHRETKQTEADEKVGSRRGGGVGELDNDARFASPLEAAPLASPALGGEPTGEAIAASKGTAETRLQAIRTLLKTLSGDRRLARTFALKAGYSESEIAEGLGREAEQTADVDPDRRCEATTRAGLTCVGRPVVDSPFCKRHQTWKETACAPVA